MGWEGWWVGTIKWLFIVDIGIGYLTNMYRASKEDKKVKNG